MAQIKVPFTLDQINSINNYQHSGVFHPFTCGVHSQGKPLRAIPKGFYCPVDGCSYTQDWCHDFMADWSWIPVVKGLRAKCEQQAKEIEALKADRFPYLMNKAAEQAAVLREAREVIHRDVWCRCKGETDITSRTCARCVALARIDSCLEAE